MELFSVVNMLTIQRLVLESRSLIYFATRNRTWNSHLHGSGPDFSFIMFFLLCFSKALSTSSKLCSIDINARSRNLHRLRLNVWSKLRIYSRSFLLVCQEHRRWGREAIVPCMALCATRWRWRQSSRCCAPRLPYNVWHRHARNVHSWTLSKGLCALRNDHHSFATWVGCRARSGVQISNDWQSQIEFRDRIKIVDNATADFVEHVTQIPKSIWPRVHGWHMHTFWHTLSFYALLGTFWCMQMSCIN